MPPRPNQMRREELLDEIEQIMITEGFLHLRVGALATRLNCSRSTLYALAESKEALFVRVVSRIIDRAVDEATMRAAEFSAPADKVVAFFSALAKHQAGIATPFWRDAYAFEPTAECFSESRDNGVSTVRGYLDDGIKAGVMRPANTQFLARVSWMTAQASRDSDVLERANISSEEALMEFCTLLVVGMDADKAAEAAEMAQRHPVRTAPA